MPPTDQSTAGQRAELDELLRPSLVQPAVRSGGGPLPWRLSSQLWIAFFGGVIALALIAALNARRLRLGGQKIAAIAGIGMLGLVAVIVAASIIEPASPAPLFTRVIAVVAYGGVYLVQRTADRVHAFHAPSDEEPYASLWVPGALACILGHAVQLGLMKVLTDAPL